MSLTFSYHTSTLSMQEENGVIMEMVTMTKVTGLDAEDFDVLMTALALPEVPKYGDRLIQPDDPLNPANNLIVAKRSAKLTDEKDNTAVDITITYEHFLQGNNQDMSIGSAVSFLDEDGEVINTPAVYGRMKSSVQQTKTNFFWDKLFNINEWVSGQIYAEGSLVYWNGFYWIATAAHAGDNDPPTYNPTPVRGWRLLDSGSGFYDTNAVADELAPFIIPNRRSKQLLVVGAVMPLTDPDSSLRGKFLSQTGEISVMQPHDTYSVKGVVRTATPWLIKRQMTGSINYNEWMDGAAYEWMCTEVGFEAITAFQLYKMNFEFQRNPDGWLPTAVFDDRRIGRPPNDLDTGIGVRSVHYHPEIDFDEFFLVAFEGWAIGGS